MSTETHPHTNGVGDHDSSATATEVAFISDASDAVAAPAPEEVKPPSFDDLDLHPDIKHALDDMGYFAPTAVQTAVFHPVTARKDLLVQSRTGTGKTTAFGLPLLNRLIPAHREPQAMILAPTRELALQVARELTNIAKHRGIVVEAIYGGAPIGKQIENLKNGVHVVVGTPGRVLDLIGRRALVTKAIDTFVLDECDEMLSMGFLPDIEEVVKHLPEKRQTLLFSATMPDEVSRFARRHMTTPETISLSRDGATIKDIHHAYYIVSGIARGRDLLKVIYSEEPESAIIFCNMRDETTMVAKYLQKQGLDAEPLSSDLSQADRERVMGRMKQKNLRFLVATDVAARGIDISNLSHVINFMVPMSPEVYVHRTGRTGRAGKKGVAISLVGPRELGNFRYVRLQFGLTPEERRLPSDDVFVGKLKVPLPPIGTPKPPDSVQILTRAVTATPTDLERQLFEKLYASSAGKRVLAMLVAEKLNELTTRSKPRHQRTERPERSERSEGGESSGGGDIALAPDGGASEGRGERSERPRGDRDRGGDRGDRPRFGGDRDRGGDRGDRPRFGGDRDRGGERGERGGDRGDRPRFGDRDRGGDRGDRPRFGERDRGERGRDRGDRPERTESTAAPTEAVAVATVSAPLEASTPTSETPSASHEGRRESSHGGGEGRREYRGGRDRNDRGDRGGERHERGERGDRDRGGRDRHEASHSESSHAEPAVTAAPVEQAPAAPAPAPAPVHAAAEAPATKVDDVARGALDRSSKKKPAKDGGGGNTQEFWETWAAEKTTREPAAKPAAAAPVAEAPEADADAGDDAGEAKRGRGGRDRGGRGKRDTTVDVKREGKLPKAEAKGSKSEAPAPKAADKKAAPAPAPAAAATGADAKLFISLGKKHGVSADDLRALLAGPVGGDKTRIGSVMLRDAHAHVKVADGDVDAIIAALNGTSHKDQSVTVERARA